MVRLTVALRLRMPISLGVYGRPWKQAVFAVDMRIQFGLPF